MILLQLHIKTKWCNHWPYIKILFNNQILFDSEIATSLDISLTLENIQNINQLKICHYGKSFGENYVYDTKIDSNGNILEDCNFQITNLLFDNIELNEKAFKRITFISNPPVDNMYLTNIVGINGEFVITFPKDIYSWLTLIKFKQDEINITEQFSNTSQLFHYEKDKKMISEIKKLLSFK